MNALKELEKELELAKKSWDDIVAAEIGIDDEEFEAMRNVDELKKRLDFNYNNEAHGYYLAGHIIFSDGSWLKRKEHNYFEFWEHMRRPDVDHFADIM